jgi:hypothetical protein
MVNETEKRIESVKHQIPRNLEECFMELEWQLKRARAHVATFQGDNEREDIR